MSTKNSRNPRNCFVLFVCMWKGEFGVCTKFLFVFWIGGRGRNVRKGTIEFCLKIICGRLETGLISLFTCKKRDLKFAPIFCFSQGRPQNAKISKLSPNWHECTRGWKLGANLKLESHNNIYNNSAGIPEMALYRPLGNCMSLIVLVYTRVFMSLSDWKNTTRSLCLSEYGNCCPWKFNIIVVWNFCHPLQVLTKNRRKYIKEYLFFR